MTEIVAAHLELVARELARGLGAIMEVRGYDWAHLQDAIPELTKPVAAALAACAREEHKATCIICSVKREPCPRLAMLAAGEKA